MTLIPWQALPTIGASPWGDGALWVAVTNTKIMNRLLFIGYIFLKQINLCYSLVVMSFRGGQIFSSAGNIAPLFVSRGPIFSPKG